MSISAVFITLTKIANGRKTWSIRNHSFADELIFCLLLIIWSPKISFVQASYDNDIITSRDQTVSIYSIYKWQCYDRPMTDFVDIFLLCCDMITPFFDMCLVHYVFVWTKPSVLLFPPLQHQHGISIFVKINNTILILTYLSNLYLVSTLFT